MASNGRSAAKKRNTEKSDEQSDAKRSRQAEDDEDTLVVQEVRINERRPSPTFVDTSRERGPRKRDGRISLARNKSSL